MTQIQQIKEYMKGKDKCHVNEIASTLTIKLNSVRGIINNSIIKGTDFERLGKGYYKIKE